MSTPSKNFLNPLADSSSFRFPNPYVLMMHTEFSAWTFEQDQAPLQRGQWKDLVPALNGVVDLEIGTGNGLHFAQRALNHPERLIVGIELKFKPLVQSIRRAVKQGCQNARMVRYDAKRIGDLFAPGEIDDVFVHFPDPWVKKKQQKKRLLNAHFFKLLFQIQKPQGKVEIKTDNFDYFQSILAEVKNSGYTVASQRSQPVAEIESSDSFSTITQFERLFLKQGLPIYYLSLIKT